MLVAIALLSPAPAAHADPMAVVNALRMEGCRGQEAAGTPVSRDETLDAVARDLSRGGRLEDAIERAGYPAATSASYHVRGSRDDAAVRQILSERSCASLNDPRYSEAGVYESGAEAWIVLAARAPSPPPLEPAAVAQRVLELVNAARAAGRTCGGARYDPTRPLTLSPALIDAASAHARDMAERGSLGHRGSDGSLSGERITRAGYLWQASGENVAAGQQDAEAVVAAWLASSGHCATLMGPYFTETGIAFALAPSKNPGIYWAQVFAAPR